MDYNKLAELLYPNLPHDMQYYIGIYKPRNLAPGAEVMRLGPSPTGYLHIGHLYSALISRITTTNTNGVFYLRLEDTDQKRYIKGAGDVAYNMLCYYGVKPDEGYTGDEKPQVGEYGPYIQSQRTEIYKAFAKELVKRGRAFPCFCGKSESKQDILERREKDLEQNDTITEHDDNCRNLSYQQIEQNIKSGKPWALKLLSTGDPSVTHGFNDLIKGKRTIRENGKDVVLVKSDGIPPYALAHVVDDTLMGTTIVVRGEEWYPSVAAHLEIFYSLGLKPPKYAHTPVISKIDDGNKRKLSKRKDPEADVRYYIEQGYPKESVIEYVLNLLNSDFELWRTQNPDADISKFNFSIKKIGSNNPMFDIDKLNNISKNVISKYTPQDIYSQVCAWAKNYDSEFYANLASNKDKWTTLFSIDRVNTPRPRKDIYAWSMVKAQYPYIYDANFRCSTLPPEHLQTANSAKFLQEYAKVYNHSNDKDAWYAQVQETAKKFGFVAGKDYKANPTAYAGTIADACALIRLALTGSNASPDLYSIMQLLGNSECLARLTSFADVIDK